MELIRFAGHDSTDRIGRPPGPIKTACPALRELFRIAEEDKGWTQVKIAEKLKRSRPVVSDWRLGKTLPNMFLYIEFAKVLGVPIKVGGLNVT